MKLTPEMAREAVVPEPTLKESEVRKALNCKHFDCNNWGHDCMECAAILHALARAVVDSESDYFYPDGRTATRYIPDPIDRSGECRGC